MVHEAPGGRIALAGDAKVAHEKAGHEGNRRSAVADLARTGIGPPLTVATVPRADVKNAGKRRFLFRKYRSP